MKVKPKHCADLQFEFPTIMLIANCQQNVPVRTIAIGFVGIIQNIIITPFLFYQYEVSLNTSLSL